MKPPIPCPDSGIQHRFGIAQTDHLTLSDLPDPDDLSRILTMRFRTEQFRRTERHHHPDPFPFPQRVFRLETHSAGAVIFHDRPVKHIRITTMEDNLGHVFIPVQVPFFRNHSPHGALPSERPIRTFHRKGSKNHFQAFSGLDLPYAGFRYRQVHFFSFCRQAVTTPTPSTQNRDPRSDPLPRLHLRYSRSTIRSSSFRSSRSRYSPDRRSSAKTRFLTMGSLSEHRAEK